MNGPDLVGHEPTLGVVTAILDSMQEGVVACDAEGKLTVFNRAVQEMTGRTEFESSPELRPAFFDVRDPASGRRLRPEEMPLVRALRGQEDTDRELVFRRASGEHGLASVSARRLVGSDGRVAGAVCVIHDVTGIRASAHRLEQAERVACFGSWELDVPSSRVFWSEGLRRLLGLEDAEASLRGWLAVVHPEDRSGVEEHLTATIEGRVTAATSSYRICPPGGGIRHVQAHTEIQYGEDGSPANMRGTLQDRSEHFEALEELRRTEERARQSDRLDSLGQLAGGIAHDFNNLLAVILNYSDFVLQDLQPEAPSRDDVVEIQRAAQRAADLTRRLLVFSRRDVVRAEIVDLGGLLEGLRTLLQRTLGEQLSIEVDIREGLPPVSADPGQLEQLVINLALNSRDAMPDGGVLRIALEGVELQAGSDTGLARGDYLRLTVSDTGIGMIPEVASHVFEPFFTTKAKGEGTGLGLATAYGLVSEAGGAINVQSSPGRGTTFIVDLPVAKERLADVEIGAAPPAYPVAGPRPTIRRILLVEDDDAVLRSTSRILREAGYEVLEADCGDAALALLDGEGDGIDLMLTDVILPGMTGMDLHDEVVRRRPGMPTIFMSGYTDDIVDRDRLAQRGGDFIAKPFTAGHLVATVAERLDRGARQALL